MKKKYFTLLEVLISLFLVSIILTFIFNFFTNLTKIEKDIETLKKEILKKNLLYIKLNNIFTNISSFYTFEKNNETVLDFIYDAKVDLDPNYSSNINAKIYCDEKHNLVLEKISNEKKEEKKEDLFENVKKIDYKFLSSDSDTTIKERVYENINWLSSWSEEKKSIPAIIFLTIDSIEYVFFTSHID